MNKTPAKTKKQSRFSPAAGQARLLKALGLYTGKWFINFFSLILALITLLLYFWAIPSLYFLMPRLWLKIAVSIFFAVSAPAALIIHKPRRRTFLTVSALTFGITVWQQSIPPTNNRDWKIPVAKLPEIKLNGGEIEIGNIRNFDYRSVTDFTPRYYSRNFKLSTIRTLDYVLSYWDGNKAIAHTIFTFGFENGTYLAVSVETRLAREQTQSLLGGIFNQYELIYVLADERDVLRLRTNFRKEQVYLYRVRIKKPLLKKLFLEIVRRAAELQQHPRFYNTVKQNCITTLLADLSDAQGTTYHFDYRFIMNGYSDALLYDEGVFVTGGLTFETLRERRHINQYVENDPKAELDFSVKIRPPNSGMKKSHRSSLLRDKNFNPIEQLNVKVAARGRARYL
ncbi:MAG: DUF4105 domain-containing protein [Victivallaceae bacterium]|nr:DUF4105 domain-containing protein [Victivallaceae bacterium]